MNLRHLYRAKVTNTPDNEWIYGSLIAMPDESMFIVPSSFAWERVDPSTVGQCTGYFAKKDWAEVAPSIKDLWVSLGHSEDDWLGVPLFEGDIVVNHMGFKQVILWEYGTYHFIELLDYVYGERQGENFLLCEKKLLDNNACITTDTLLGNLTDTPQLLPEKEGT